MCCENTLGAARGDAVVDAGRARFGARSSSIRSATTAEPTVHAGAGDACSALGSSGCGTGDSREATERPGGGD